jgi:hypothetical protein
MKHPSLTYGASGTLLARHHYVEIYVCTDPQQQVRPRGRMVSLNYALSGLIRDSYLTCRRVILLCDRLTTDQFGIVRNWQWPTR